MLELEPGLWHWTAPHPDWVPRNGGPDGWPQEVSSYAVDDGRQLIVFDPIAPPSLLDEVASGRKAVVVLTCPWHDRDSAQLIDRLGAEVHGPPRDEGAGQVEGPVFERGGAPVPGVVALEQALEDNDLLLWIEARRALVVGDVLIDRGDGLVIPETWTPTDVSRAERARILQPLLDLPIERVLPTHGPPADRAALERALS